MDKSYRNGGFSKKPRLMTRCHRGFFVLSRSGPTCRVSATSCNEAPRYCSRTEIPPSNALAMPEICGKLRKYVVTSLILITIISDVLLEREDLSFDSFGAYSFVKMLLTVDFLSQMKPPSRGSICFWPQLPSLGRSTTGSVSIPKISLR